MIIFRKLYSAPQQESNAPEGSDGGRKMTSRELALEEGRQQRQLLITQRMRYKLQADERQARNNRIIQLQRMEQKKDIEEDKQRVRIKKAEESDQEMSTLYKSKPKSVAPVPMS